MNCIFQPSKVLRHPDYVRAKKDHDVALLLFERPGFVVNSFVRPICLWNQDFDFSLIAGTEGDVSRENISFCFGR